MLARVVVAIALLGVVSAARAAEPVGVAGVRLNDLEADVRPGLAQTGCRPVLTQLSRDACGMQIAAWGSPVIAMFVFDGEPDRRLVIITLSFEAAEAAAIERGLLGEYGAPDTVKEGDPYWSRGDAVMWIQRERRRVVLARRDQVDWVHAR